MTFGNGRKSSNTILSHFLIWIYLVPQTAQALHGRLNKGIHALVCLLHQTHPDDLFIFQIGIITSAI